MSLVVRTSAVVCRRCVRASKFKLARGAAYSSASSPHDVKSTIQDDTTAASKQQQQIQDATKSPEDVQGAMSRRLEEATEDALFTGGRAGQRAIQDAGFSDELKEKLLDKIADAKFRKDYASAFATTEIPESAGEGTRSIAGAQPWLGTEATEDTVLRMLDDARKPLKPGNRGRFEIPPVDMRIKKAGKVGAGQRISNAREKVMQYEDTKQKGSSMSSKEREDYKKELAERFQPGARNVSIAGIAALANERIEDAIARGQFKNIPRGPGIERDKRADNPFIDTTEYIMNKMIARQDLVPPWIEKQQEVAKNAGAFRARLRNDWKRHAARMIASEGGGLEAQLKKAELNARSERVWNPRKKSVDGMTIAANATDDPVMAKLRQQIVEETAEEVAAVEKTDAKDEKKQEVVEAAVEAAAEALVETVEPPKPVVSEAPLPRPYRDPTWEQSEMKYLNLSIDTLNTAVRSYNLQAPDLAKKPYFSLQRELEACYSDVAPLLVEEIRERALGPKAKPAVSKAGIYERKGDGIWESFRKGDSVRIHVEGRDKAYGFREWWKDMRGMWKKD